MRVGFFLGLVVLFMFVGGAMGQLVVFDNSHAPANEIFDDLKAHLEVWGYTVESRTTPLMDNGDADVIVILPQDAYTVDGADYTADEAAWLMEHVDSGKGLFAGMCPSLDLWLHITPLLDTFGIALGDYISNPAYYAHFSYPTLFDGVITMGDTVSHCLSLLISPPSVSVAQDDWQHDFIAIYEPVGRHDGAAIWVSQYKMATVESMYEYHNLRFLSNAFAWLANTSHVHNEDSSWGEVKKLYR